MTDRTPTSDAPRDPRLTSRVEAEANGDAATPAIGRHVLLDLYEVTDRRATSAEALCTLLCDCLDAAGFQRLGVCSHQFPGNGAGATAIVLLSESHAAIHTYPERAYIAVDVFSCGKADLEAFVETMLTEFAPGRYERREQSRGAELSRTDR